MHYSVGILSLLTFFSVVFGFSAFLEDKYPATVIEDAIFDTAKLLTKYKYPVQRHYATTPDKYILCLFRIPRPMARPIFLMHGLFDSSDTWIFMGPAIGLGYYLYEKGYDVWMGNARGNRYSRNHTSMDPDTSPQFWQFSWHEIGFNDLPAMINYVLQQTNQQKVTYIGHSQGTTSFFVMCSTNPNCSSKISSMHAIAPVAFMKHMKTPLLQFAKISFNFLDGKLLEMPFLNEFVLNTCFVSKLALKTCQQTMYQLMGKETKETNSTMWPVIFGHVPAGAAVRQVNHYLQLADSDRFCQYDFGAAENLKRYGMSKPPDYSVDRIKVPIGLYYTFNDYLTNEIDVERLARILPNVVAKIGIKKWSHITPVWGNNARELLHTKILKIIEQFA